MHAMPVMIVVLCVMAIAYRYYSAFLAAKVAVLDDTRVTPAIKFNDGQNYHPTNKWVLFGHHFAAISGAGPLVGPVLAAQFGYLPGLIWIVVGVCLAGAVQDFLVLSASLRRGGKSLAQIAFSDIGPVAGTASMLAILFIVVIALAGLGIVVVKALGGDPVHHVKGSSWGTFTIAATIPIALLVGLWMYKLRPGKVVEASLIGAVLTLFVTFAGAWVSEHPIGNAFNLTAKQVTYAMAIYGFVAAVLPVWILLAPRDYLSSFLKIATIALLVLGTLFANPILQAPAVNHVFLHGGPTVGGNIFPFLFITIMCGAISGFHALVSSGTTPKMVTNERHARPIGYGAMLIEGLVGVVAMIAAASLPTNDYYAMNTELSKAPAFHERILQVGGGNGVEHIGQYEQLTQESLRGRTGGAVTLAVGMAHIFTEAAKNVSISSEHAVETMWKYWYHFAIMFEALFILTTIDAGTRIGRFLLQEAAGKVIHPKLADQKWWPGAIASTLVIVIGWSYLILNASSFDAVWQMFGIANQMLAVIALAVISVYLFNEGRVRYIWVTAIPMAVVMTTTGSAAVLKLSGAVDTVMTQINNQPGVRSVPTLVNGIVSASLILAMLICTGIVIVSGAMKVLRIGSGVNQTQPATVPIT
jgi:carbon starvation protein